MSHNTFGHLFRVTTWGESHGPALGCVVDGCPPGVRLTAEGRLLLCLGNEHSVDLKHVLRAYPGDRDALRQAVIKAMDLKPERHYFDDRDAPQIVRFMNMTGG